MTGVEFERPLAAGLEAVGGGRPFCTGRAVGSVEEVFSRAEMASPFGFATISSVKGGMSSVGTSTARSGMESGEEIKSCIWAEDSLRVGEGESSFPLLVFLFKTRDAVVVGVPAEPAVFSDKASRPGLVNSRSDVYEVVPCSVMGDSAGVGNWSWVAVASLSSGVRSFIVREGRALSSEWTSHQCVCDTRKAGATITRSLCCLRI